jgi:hypothetical protein
MDDLLERLERARVAADTLATLQGQAAELPGLQAEVATRARLDRARIVADQTEADARAAVEVARPALADWQGRFVEWARAGWRLVGELRAVEGPLVAALDQAIAGAAGWERAQSYEPGAWDERVILADTDGAVDRVLQRLGVADLGPLPDQAGNPFAEAAKRLVLEHLGQRVFIPALGRVQFKRSQVLPPMG